MLYAVRSAIRSLYNFTNALTWHFIYVIRLLPIKYFHKCIHLQQAFLGIETDSKIITRCGRWKKLRHEQLVWIYNSHIQLYFIIAI